MLEKHRERADRFFELHRDFFILPTIWDPLSALAAEDAGFPAVATSSAALGYANGYLASERVPLGVVTARLRAIAETVAIPLSVDFEDGYPDARGDVTDSIRAIIDAGSIAANIEDSPGSHSVPLVPAEDHARVIERARQAADRAGARFFVNARTDTLLLEAGLEHAGSVKEAIRRANLYLDAGADGVYVTAKNPQDEEIAALAAEIKGPLTVIAPNAGGAFGHWKSLGVKRLSLGTVIVRNAFAAIQSQLRALDETGTTTISAPVDIDGALRHARAARSQY